MTCKIEECPRKVWFTEEQLCRPHGLAVGADDPVHDGFIPDDDPLWQPSPKATRPSKSKPEEA